MLRRGSRPQRRRASCCGPKLRNRHEIPTWAYGPRSDVLGSIVDAASCDPRRVVRRDRGFDFARPVAVTPAGSALTDECMEFLLELLRFDLSDEDRLWFFSDWLHASLPRTFEERLHDFCLSRHVAIC